MSFGQKNIVASKIQIHFSFAYFKLFTPLFVGIRIGTLVTHPGY